MEFEPEDVCVCVSLLEKCPHFRECYSHRLSVT